MSADGYNFAWQSTTFPNPTGPDNVSSTILRFFQNIIQINLGTSFATDAISCGLVNPTFGYIVNGNMCPQAVSFPVDSLLKTTNFKFPLLSAYRLTREFQQFTDMKLMIKSNYAVNFILPPLSVEQYNVLYKYLAEVSDVLVDRSWRGFDINYNGGEQVWKTAKIAYTLLNKDEYGSFLGQDGKTEFPSIRFHMSVLEESQFVESNYPAMSNIFVKTDLYDGYNLSNPYDNIADGYVNPDLSVISLSVNSGTAAGGTVVAIMGDGFLNVLPSQLASYAVTLNGAPVNKILVKSNQIIIVVSGPGPLGSGDIVITDKLGETSILVGEWVYI